jgi:hypothetical protein
MPGRAPTKNKADRNIKAGAKPVSVPASPRGKGANEEQQAAKGQAPTSVQPVEPEDAYLTGVSRSLQRRLLGLNVDGARGQAKPHPEAAAGQHATGSFTDSKPAGVPAKAAKKIKNA